MLDSDFNCAPIKILGYIEEGFRHRTAIVRDVLLCHICPVAPPNALSNSAVLHAGAIHPGWRTRVHNLGAARAGEATTTSFSLGDIDKSDRRVVNRRLRDLQAFDSWIIETHQNQVGGKTLSLAEYLVLPSFAVKLNLC